MTNHQIANMIQRLLIEHAETLKYPLSPNQMKEHSERSERIRELFVLLQSNRPGAINDYVMDRLRPLPL